MAKTDAELVADMDCYVSLEDEAYGAAKATVLARMAELRAVHDAFDAHTDRANAAVKRAVAAKEDADLRLKAWNRERDENVRLRGEVRDLSSALKKADALLGQWGTTTARNDMELELAYVMNESRDAMAYAADFDRCAAQLQAAEARLADFERQLADAKDAAGCAVGEGPASGTTVVEVGGHHETANYVNALLDEADKQLNGPLSGIPSTGAAELIAKALRTLNNSILAERVRK